MKKSAPYGPIGIDAVGNLALARKYNAYRPQGSDCSIACRHRCQSPDLLFGSDSYGVQKLSTPRTRKASPYEPYVGRIIEMFESIGKHLCITFEHKGPNTLGFAEPRALFCRWIAQFVDARDRWSLASHSIDDILPLYRTFRDAGLP